MTISGTQLVAGNITRFGGGFIKHVNTTMKLVESMLDRRVTRNISLTDHSPSDLAALDHPYASRHGSKGLQIHDPYWSVHSQSGNLLRSKKSGTEKASVTGGNLKASAFVGINDNGAPYAIYIIYGTSKMIPRDFLENSKSEVEGQAVALIGKNLKNLVTNFRGK